MKMRFLLAPSLIILVILALLSTGTLMAQSASLDSTILSFRVLYNQGQRYAVLLTTRGCFILKGKDTVIRHPGDYFHSVAVKDFNKDGHSDILMERVEITPAVYDLLLYDPNSKTFREVKDFDMFPDPTRIPGTKLYYSYHTNGCADMNWESDLFYLSHFRTVLVGNINGNGCEPGKRSIRIYKGTASGRVLIKTLPIGTIREYRNNKWGFIKHYWSKKYRRFL